MNPLRHKLKSGKILTEKEELFCNHYVLNYNRIDAAEEAYNIDKFKKGWRETASNIAGENLLKPHINVRIRELLDKFHLNDENVDCELSFVIQQRAELAAKNTAIREYNLIKGRHAPQEHKFKFEKMSDEELREQIAEETAALISDEGGTQEEG